MGQITKFDSVIDSRDVIARIEELRDELLDADILMENEDGKIVRTDKEPGDKSEELEEYQELVKLEGEASSCADWRYGETLIRDDYFPTYIEELIDDCYEMPKEMKSGGWPWRHMKIDFEAAANEARVDYTTVEYFGTTFLIRS